MNIPSSPCAETDASLILSSQNQGWENLLIEQFREPPGEGSCHHSDEHTICLALDTRPIHLLQIREGKTYTGIYAKGDLSITPAQMPFFARWEGEDHYLKIRLPSRFIQQIAREALEMDGDRLELLPQARIRDPQIEAIGRLLLSELHRGQPTSRLYVESLANVLAVHLIRQYTNVQPVLLGYEGGLPHHQLIQVLDYVDAHLHQDIKLADLAALLSISQFHFSHQFKQATGISPYQYLLQQRIERAKQLLKQSDRSIADIAVLCGFNSHSHLSKQFRQLTGTTPKAYRLHSS
ncbi:MAG: helix-turn-helix domain-containing protein [Oscillatoriophycideae cyanobacterium NC_groundwater_1537_Pr4_S-0.65um_50_18]|nr:helix-turn-helix domain-containing protein [Oscillatoriophycideae cyanobacterium NC_groundwater_1537_Pr4_S-0.65um_50_18]